MGQIKNLIVNKIALVDSPANREVFTVIKQDSGPRQGQSEKDYIWNDVILPAFDKWQVAWHDRQTAAYVAPTRDGAAAGTGVKYSDKSREQLLSEFLLTSEGKRLYQQYSDASDTVSPVAKSDTPEQPATLREYAETRLAKIAEKYQTGGITIEAATVEAINKSAEYREIYTLLHDCGPLENINFSQTVSKSKSDAISAFKGAIDAAARRAGV